MVTADRLRLISRPSVRHGMLQNIMVGMRRRHLEREDDIENFRAMPMVTNMVVAGIEAVRPWHTQSNSMRS